MRIRRILASLVVVAVAGGAAYLGTSAFFSDTETSTGNVLSAGEIDLLVQGHFQSAANGGPSFNFPQGSTAFFNFTDLKPGDMGGGRVEMSATSNPYYACFGASDVASLENTLAEPELELNDTAAQGELQDYLYIALWNDTTTNGQYDAGEIVLLSPVLASTLSATPWIPLSDSTGGVFGAGPLVSGQPYNIGMKYCFGSFDANLNCTPAIGGNENIAMTDSLSGDLKFYAVQSRNNANFTCASMNQSAITVGAKLAGYQVPTCTTTVSGSSSIQTAVNVASDNSTVCVDTTYNGAGDNAAIRIEKLGLKLAATTQGVALDVPVVLSNSNVTVTGFTGVIGTAESPSEQAAFYLDDDALGAVISYNKVVGSGAGAGILTESGASLAGVVLANNVLSGATQGIYLNPHTGVVTIQYNDINNNAVGIGNLTGSLVQYNEFKHASASQEAIGAGNGTFGDYDGSKVQFNNFLDGTMIKTYAVTTNVDAPNNYFNVGGASQAPSNVNYSPVASAMYLHQ